MRPGPSRVWEPVEPGTGKAVEAPDVAPAGFGRRLAAHFVDFALRLVFLLPFSLWIWLEFGAFVVGEDGLYYGLEGWPVWAWAAGWTAFTLAYFVGFEAFGASPGKRLLGLRVRARDGGPLSARQVALRNLVRPLDAVPLWIVGGALVLFHPHRARLGDLLGGTVVVGAWPRGEAGVRAAGGDGAEGAPPASRRRLRRLRPPRPEP